MNIEYMSRISQFCFTSTHSGAARTTKKDHAIHIMHCCATQLYKRELKRKEESKTHDFSGEEEEKKDKDETGKFIRKHCCITLENR